MIPKNQTILMLRKEILNALNRQIPSRKRSEFIERLIINALDKNHPELNVIRQNQQQKERQRLADYAQKRFKTMEKIERTLLKNLTRIKNPYDRQRIIDFLEKQKMVYSDDELATDITKRIDQLVTMIKNEEYEKLQEQLEDNEFSLLIGFLLRRGYTQRESYLIAAKKAVISEYREIEKNRFYSTQDR